MRRRVAVALVLLGACHAEPPRAAPVTKAKVAPAPPSASASVVASASASASVSAAPPEVHQPVFDVDAEVSHDCVWSSDESLVLCGLGSEDGFWSKESLAFLGANKKPETMVLLDLKGDAFTNWPPVVVPQASRAALRKRIETKHYRRIADEECKPLETLEKPVRADFPRFSVRLTLVDKGYSCPGGWCGVAHGRYDLACAAPKPTFKTVLTVTGHSVAISNEGRACLLDDRFVLVQGGIGGRNELGHRSESSAVLLDVDASCPKAK